MPLKSSMSEAEIMHDLKHGKHHKNRAKHGEAAAHRQEVAIMMDVKRKGRKQKRKKSRG